MLSFWEKQSFFNYDCIIIGSGIVGLSTACSLKEKYPEKSVLVLERGILPTGASTKNAGFACYGSAAEIWNDVQLLGWEKALEVVELRVKGLCKLRSRLGDAAIEYEENGGGEIILKGDSFDLNSLDAINENLKTIFSKPVFIPEPKKPEALGFQTKNIQTYISNTVEGQIDTGKMMRSLIEYSQKLGISILTGFHVEHLEKQNSNWQISGLVDDHKFLAPNLYICTNAFTKGLLPNLDIQPGRGQVLVTSPIPDLRFKGIYHFDQGYYYFRNVGNRVLFGGGRNIDFEGETSTSFELNPTIQNQLEWYLRELILPARTDFKIEHRWAGIMAFGTEKTPIVMDYGNGMKIGCRMNGMGVALGTEIGEQLASMTLQ
ncbi:MAG TPA: FAD-dependent oxidoreductase [Catalimonadaceae bacterium]|jgi:gamma-glutamylputrescine oxidase|nr:FAD-dependent oxidoreductase [Catalimonadaceae bacterium]